VVRAWQEKAETTAMWENPVTHAAGLRVPGPFAGRQMLRILRETQGGALAVSEDEIVEGQRLLARTEGIWTAPEAAAALAALLRLRAEGSVGGDDRVVMVLTGCGLKNPPPPLPPAVHLEGSPDEMLAAVRRAVGA
jgi:threonine synthase